MKKIGPRVGREGAVRPKFVYADSPLDSVLQYDNTSSGAVQKTFLIHFLTMNLLYEILQLILFPYSK